MLPTLLHLILAKCRGWTESKSVQFLPAVLPQKIQKKKTTHGFSPLEFNISGNSLERQSFLEIEGGDQENTVLRCSITRCYTTNHIFLFESRSLPSSSSY